MLSAALAPGRLRPRPPRRPITRVHRADHGARRDRVADLHGDYDRFVFILAHPQIGLVDADLHWIGGKAWDGTAQRRGEIYNPATGKFHPTGSSMRVARKHHTATLLRDGEVLIAGGEDNNADIVSWKNK